MSSSRSLPSRSRWRSALLTPCLLALVAVLLVACGSRVKAGSVDEGLGNATGGTTAATTAATGGTGQPAANMVGTMPSPCGPGHATGTTDKGVTPTTIKIGVISDKNGIGGITVPTVGIQGSMQAFVAYCNSLGGVRGRKLQLVTFDSKLFQENEAMKQACSSGIFALVGSGSVADDQGAQTMVDCKLVEVAGYTATYAKGLSPRVFSVIPNPGNIFPTGPARYIAKQFPDAIKKAGIVYPSTPDTAKNQAKRMEQATIPLGFKYIADTPTAPLVTNWAPIVQSLKDKGVQYLTAITTVDQTVQMLKAMKVAGFAPKVVDLAQQYYDPALASSGVAEGAYVLTNTQPFEEPNAAIDLYNQWLKQAGGGTAPTTLGVESFSAGLLFAKVAGSLGSHVTRDNLIKGLTKVTSWDAGGLHPAQNPGQNKANSCVLYLQVKGGKFVRVFPDQGFACNAANTAPVSGDFGKVPVEK